MFPVLYQNKYTPIEQSNILLNYLAAKIVPCCCCIHFLLPVYLKIVTVKQLNMVVHFIIMMVFSKLVAKFSHYNVVTDVNNNILLRLWDTH